MKKKRVLWISLGLLAAILLTILAFVLYYLFILKNTLRDITTTESPEKILGVYVRQEDEAVSVADTAGYTYGVSWNEPDRNETEMLLNRLEELWGSPPDTVAFPDIFALTDGLRDGTIGALILNEAYKDTLAETEGYEWTKDGLRRLEVFAFEQEEEAHEKPEVPDTIPDTVILYISGIDTYGGLSARSRSDVNILVAANTRTKDILMVATPRDFYVDFAASKGQKDKLTHAGIYGVGASMDALERLYTIQIPYYLRINFSGFIDVIDALGGVDVYSDYDFSVKNIKDYHKGYNHLTGLEALAFARERYSFPQGDYQRAKNQMEVIKAVINACTSPAVLKNFRSVMNAIGGSFETNMPEGQILDLVKMQMADEKPWNITTYTTNGTSAYKPTYSMPGRNLYVILPNAASVEEAKALLSGILTAEQPSALSGSS